jgi:hypothetical protein
MTFFVVYSWKYCEISVVGNFKDFHTFASVALLRRIRMPSIGCGPAGRDASMWFSL